MKLGLVIFGLLALSVPVWAYTNSSSPESACIQNLSDVQDVAFSGQLQDVAICTINNTIHNGTLATVVTAVIIGGVFIGLFAVGLIVVGFLRGW